MNPQVSTCPERHQLLLLQQDSLNPELRESLENHIELCCHCQLHLQLDAAQRCQNLPPQLLLQTPAKPTPNQVLANCQLLKPLGIGAASIVWLALELPTHRHVALKLLPAQPALLDENRRRWLAEVHVAARMQHPNLTRLYRVEETPDWFALVFEFVPGPTLATKLRQQIPTPQTAASILHTIASAVHAIHQQQVLHLDLKPSNILLDNSLGDDWLSLIPKVSDFGISTHLQSHKFTNSPASGLNHRPPGCGTPPWTAPEQLILPPYQLTPAADVYALGSLLYALLTAQPPHTASESGNTSHTNPVAPNNSHDSLKQLLRQDLVNPQSLQPSLPDELAQICLKCLQTFPAQRFQSALELANALAPWARQPTTHHPQAPKIRKYARLAAGTCAAIAATLIALPHVTPNAPSNTIDSHTTNSSNSLSHSAADPFDSLLARDPAGLTTAAANRLAVLAQQHTQTALTKSPHATPELLKLGRLLQRAGERINSSIHSSLYPAATQLILNSEQLLLAAHHTNPDDQRTLHELAASQILLGTLKSAPVTDTENVLRDKVAKLIECSQTASRMSDATQQTYWVSRTLDACRLNILLLQWNGNPQLACELRDNFSHAVRKIQSARTPDITLRLCLWNPDTFVDLINANTETVANPDDWTFPDDIHSLKLEAVCNVIAQQLFSLPDSSPISPEKAQQILSHAHNLLQLLHIDPQTLPAIIHEELVRPVATIASQARALNRLEKAEHVQQAYLALVLAAESRFPNHPDILLALSEAHLQNWKNLLRRDLDQPAVNALRKSLAAAEAAWQAAPHSSLAYRQIADRLQRLERFNAGR